MGAQDAFAFPERTGTRPPAPGVQMAACGVDGEVKCVRRRNRGSNRAEGGEPFLPRGLFLHGLLPARGYFLSLTPDQYTQGQVRMTGAHGPLREGKASLTGVWEGAAGGKALRAVGPC